MEWYISLSGLMGKNDLFYFKEEKRSILLVINEILKIFYDNPSVYTDGNLFFMNENGILQNWGKINIEEIKRLLRIKKIKFENEINKEINKEIDREDFFKMLDNEEVISTTHNLNKNTTISCSGSLSL